LHASLFIIHIALYSDAQDADMINGLIDKHLDEQARIVMALALAAARQAVASGQARIVMVVAALAAATMRQQL
jgi:hypothetical protein